MMKTQTLKEKSKAFIRGEPIKYEKLNKGIARQIPVDVQNNYVFLQEKLEVSPHPVMVSLSRLVEVATINMCKPA
jgi:hypothetical protein